MTFGEQIFVGGFLGLLLYGYILSAISIYRLQGKVYCLHILLENKEWKMDVSEETKRVLEEKS